MYFSGRVFFHAKVFGSDTFSPPKSFSIISIQSLHNPQKNPKCAVPAFQIANTFRRDGRSTWGDTAYGIPEDVIIDWHLLEGVGGLLTRRIPKLFHDFSKSPSKMDTKEPKACHIGACHWAITLFGDRIQSMLPDGFFGWILWIVKGSCELWCSSKRSNFLFSTRFPDSTAINEVMIAELINTPQGTQTKTDFQGFLVIVINPINAPPIKWLCRIFAALPQIFHLEKTKKLILQNWQRQGKLNPDKLGFSRNELLKL